MVAQPLSLRLLARIHATRVLPAGWRQGTCYVGHSIHQAPWCKSIHTVVVPMYVSGTDHAIGVDLLENASAAASKPPRPGAFSVACAGRLLEPLPWLGFSLAEWGPITHLSSSPQPKMHKG